MEENSWAKLTKRSRIFEEVGVGNFVAQQRAERFPSTVPQNQPPVVARWRSNLCALSQKYNLYFAASEDKIHITAPRDLKQTIPGIPDLILDLPRTAAGIKLGGYIAEEIPHCVNHIKIGNLGQLEVLLMGCDDGDVLAYYTHLLPDEISKKDPRIVQTIVSRAVPFFHENVGSSVWGLALHQNSRLIAVSSNLREVTIFAHGYTAFGGWADIVRKEGMIGALMLYGDRLRCVELQASAGNQKFTTLLDGNIAGQRLYNYRMTMPLGNQGHNIPSVDFVTGPDGNASHALAADINGNLWTFDLLTGEKQCRPCSHTVPDRETVMGWGVLCLPVKYFKVVKTPQEALGLPRLQSSFVPGTSKVSQCFNITSTLQDVREHSGCHPIFHYGINGPGTRIEDDVNRRLQAMPRLYPDIRETEVPEARARRSELDLEKIAPDIKTLKFLLDLPHDNRPHTWQEIKEKEAASNEGLIQPRSDSSSPKKAASGEHIVREEVEVQLLPGSAILRTYNHDIELIPPNSPAMLRTFFGHIVRQQLGHLRNELRHFDRLNMLAFIPELSLVVAASQIGRAALLTLTRLEDDFSSVGPVVMFRLDLILPLKQHEDFNRPERRPLAGMAVAPLQASEAGRREGWASERRWRLLMHYEDQTVLSYELFRNEGEELIVL